MSDPTATHRPDGGAPVRVLHVLGRLSVGGGIQIVVRRLLAALDPRRVEVDIVTTRGDDPRDRLHELPATVHTLGFSSARLRPAERVRVLLGVTTTVRRVRPQVVQLHSGLAWMGLGARLVSPRTRLALEVHDAPGSGRNGEWSDRLEGWIVRRLGAVAICHSSSVAAEVQRRWHPPAGRVVTFPLAVDLTSFTPERSGRAPWREALGIPRERVVLLGVGRFVPSKRFERLVDVVEQLHLDGLDVGLVLVGQGSEEAALRARAAASPAAERIVFTGSRYGADLAAAFAAADVLCSPSAYEGFGLTLVEGMASGLPVVATAVGGVTDLVDDGVSGHLVPADDFGRFTERVRAVVVDGDVRTRMGDAGRRRAIDRYGVDSMATAFTELYERLAGVLPGS